jgi:hypothetical protein
MDDEERERSGTAEFVVAVVVQLGDSADTTLFVSVYVWWLKQHSSDFHYSTKNT